MVLTFVRKVEWLTEQLRAKDFTVSAIHGDLDQEKRNGILSEFRSGSSRILITTDLLARGIDVHGVRLFFLLKLPENLDQFFSILIHLGFLSY